MLQISAYVWYFQFSPHLPGLNNQDVITMSSLTDLIIVAKEH